MYKYGAVNKICGLNIKGQGASTYLRLFQKNGQWNDVEFFGNFARRTQSPVSAPFGTVQFPIDLLHEAFDVNDWMAGKDLRESIGKVARQAFSRPLLQVELKNEAMV